MKSPPSKKLPGIYERHNTRPMRKRQPPTMLGERVFTSVVDISDENLDVPTLHHFHTPPYYPTIEATSIEMESHQIDVVDLTTPTLPSKPDPTSVDLLEDSFGNSSGISNSRKKVKFSPEVHTTRSVHTTRFTLAPRFTLLGPFFITFAWFFVAVQENQWWIRWRCCVIVFGVKIDQRKFGTIEATSIETESHQIDVVDLTTPTLPSTPDPTSVDLLENSFENSSGISNSIANPRKKVKFSPEVHTTRFHPSGLPSETTESVSNPIVLDPDWLNSPSIISAIELLGWPMTLDEMRRWTINRAANRDAI